MPGTPPADGVGVAEDWGWVEPAVGSGVLEAVESPELQPTMVGTAMVSSATPATAPARVPIVTVQFTSAHRTGPAAGLPEGARRKALRLALDCDLDDVFERGARHCRAGWRPELR